MLTVVVEQAVVHLSDKRTEVQDLQTCAIRHLKLQDTVCLLTFMKILPSFSLSRNLNTTGLPLRNASNKCRG